MYMISEGLLTMLLGFLLSFVFTKRAIPIIRQKQLGQNIREEGPKSHQKKSGTPSMGGVAIILSCVIASLIGGYSNGNIKEIIVVLIGFIAFGIIGFLDDYLKVIKKQNEGLKPYQKFGLQLIFSICFAVYMAKFSGVGTAVYIPFVKVYIDFGIWYIPFVVFTVLAMTNGVNLTDGLDGLASGVTFVVCAFMGAMATALGNVPSEIFYKALGGACLGFLVFNKNPAKIFMGDTGSLGIGGGITVAAFMMKMEFLLPIVGIVYVLETVSVVLQVGYFKITKGKRLFKMAPLHHHFEECGMKEINVVYMFWIITMIFAIITRFFV